MGEFDLIARIRQRAATRPDVVLGIGDDCALLMPPPGMQLAVTVDTLNAGIHFPDDTAPADLGWKALAVSLSDLAAMGATPAWCTLALTLPTADAEFVDGLLDGFLELAAQQSVALIGGDTTRGSLAIGVTAHGLIEPGRALRRDGAAAGDEIWVSGTLGDAAAALQQWRAHSPRDATLQARLDRPTPRVGLARALRGLATACIDVSDGLLADLGHVCAASGVGARVDVDALPASDALRAAFAGDVQRCLQASGGDDYELCFCASPMHHHAVLAAASATATPVTCIGVMTRGTGVYTHDRDGRAWSAPATGFDHFIASA